MPDSNTATTSRLPGKIAVVSGAGSGIGRATSITFAQHGAGVWCADINLAAAEQTVADIVTAGGQAWPTRLDVASESDWMAVLNTVLEKQGRLDILLNCAGISFAAPVVDMTLDEWRRVMAVNLESVFLGTKHAIRVMRQCGGQGSIINVSSVSGIKAQPTASAYCTSKAAIIMFSKVAALECLRHGDKIRVNAVSPSGVKTPMWQTMPFFQELIAKEGSEEAAFQAMTQGLEQNRFASPEEIALAILYLASDESLFVTGSNLVIDHGDTA